MARLIQKCKVIVCWVMLLLQGLFPLPTEARSIYAPWEPQVEQGFESLVYGASSTVDVQRVMGSPDEIVRSGQMFPVVENYYYHDESGAASVLVFQNGLLASMFYQSPDKQLIDLTYFLVNNGDRRVNAPLNAGYPYYHPTLPFYEWY